MLDFPPLRLRLPKPEAKASSRRKAIQLGEGHLIKNGIMDQSRLKHIIFIKIMQNFTNIGKYDFYKKMSYSILQNVFSFTKKKL